MTEEFIATATVTIDARPSRVWEAITDPVQIEKFMFGSVARSDWKVGSPITYSGVWNGKPFEDKGIILDLVPNTLLRSTHYSPLSGKPDQPENYQTITYELQPDDDRTIVTLTQDHNESAADAEHSATNWSMMLGGLKQVVEAQP